MPLDVAAEVTANRPLSADYNVVTLAAPAIAAAAAPGQFVMVKAGAGQVPLLRRPFSIFEVVRANDGTPTAITLLNKRIGIATALLYSITPGERVACLGPLGRPWPISDQSREACLVAGGVGLAAFVTLAEALTSQRVPTVLFYGARSGDELFYVDLFRRLGVRVVSTTEDGSAGERGLVTAPLERYLAERKRQAVVYSCGPERMMAAVTAVAMRHECACHVSLERIMGCGLGGCYSCVVPIRHGAGFHHVRSCIAGPVMAGEQVVWD